jgi:hypothetical protein
MESHLKKREFLTAALGIGAGLGLAATSAFGQAVPAPATAPRRREIPHRVAKTTPLFKSPPGYPNALAVNTDAPGGLWIGEQKLSGALAAQYGVAAPTDLREAAWLVDWNGKLQKTVMTEARNTSGMAYGDGYIWMCAEFAAPFDGIYQTDMNSHTVSHRQIPLGPPQDGGGCHGAFWQDGKLWVMSNRLRAILRIEPKTWTPEFLIPLGADIARYHAIAWDNGAIWAVTGNNSTRFSEGKPGLVKYDATTGALLETVEFAPGSSDPHGLVMHNGALVSCDAGIHPGWPNLDSPTSGYIFRIDLV